MKVLHLRASNFHGGPERQLLGHAVAARGTGFEVIVASFSEAGAAPEFLQVMESEGVPTRLIRIRSSYDAGAIALVAEALRSDGIALLATHDYRSHAVGWLAARRAGCAWIAFSRGFTRENLKVRMFQELEKILIRFARGIVAVSTAQKEKLLRLGIAGDRITVVRNAVDYEAMVGIPPVDLRDRYGFPARARVVVAAGRLSSEKGQIDLVRAAAVLRDRPELRFLLLGDGPDRASLLAEVARLGLSESVLLPGFQRDVIGCLRGADLVVNPSLSEGLPNVLLEAMAVGTPVVATAVGGVPELVTTDVNGRLVPPGRPDLLAGAIRDLLDDPAAAATLADSAAESIRRDFSFAGQLPPLLAAYRAALGGAA